MSTVLRAIAGYFFLLLTVRALGRRPGAQLTLFEFVIVFLIGGVVILATVSDDRSEVNSVCAVLTVGLLHRLISKLKERFPKLERIIDGGPVLLYKDGEWQDEMLYAMRVQQTDVMAAARAKGLRNFDEIKYAVLERNGSISLIKAEQ